MEKIFKVNENVKWVPLFVEGNINCPFCEKIMIIFEPSKNYPSFSFCKNCEQYFYDGGPEINGNGFEKYECKK